ncbi:two component transcriptional regulator, LuxR family [Bryocella elongata]|uniref:Two component transcriptional regulator, LuxR family n=1 Tax=Bryocella elongata TaxID=863522 RepID=A0A1H5UTG7_9BACT|nr:response regulator transcription factor [Bryocella elongata]SEF78363.1 two component transcriptional regulator, LuxR family [Bryocella elongata]
MTDMVRILLIDDHTIFRESLLRLLVSEPGLEVVAHCATITEGRDILARMDVHIVLLDYDLGEEAGTTLLTHLKERNSAARVVMLTAGMMPSATLTAIDAGVAGVVLKHSGTSQLLEAIRKVANGGTWWDTAFLRSILSGSDKPNDVPAKQTRDLTKRQQLVLRCILDGLSNKEISAHLECSEAAVKASIQELFAKAGVRTRTQLVRIAIERFSADWLQGMP